MTPSKCKCALKVSTEFEMATPLMIRSGRAGVYTDSMVERAVDGRLHINGYVWASLVRRSMNRVAGAEETAAGIGGYDASTSGVSPFWCEASFAELAPGPYIPDLCPADVRHGIRIDRKLGAAADNALYSDEAVPPGYRIRMDANYFCQDAGEAERFFDRFLSALWVIDQGVETIGGGWSYGYGRLTPIRVRRKRLDLSDPGHRTDLWRYDQIEWDADETWENLAISSPAVSRPWTRISIDAGVLDGQLMAVSTTLPPFDLDRFPDEAMPDSFVFRRLRLTENNETAEEIVTPGKAIRQALLSMPLERKFRSEGKPICRDTGRANGCDCNRCRWFGAVDRRGIVSVADAVVRGAETAVLNRVQLCEHSFQNMQLFTGEFLTRGDFRFDILVDHADKPSAEEALAALREILAEMAADGKTAPPGWHRVGGKSTCAGQVAVRGVSALANGVERIWEKGA